ncbi:MAG: class I SAM-dependent methyltransferase [Burkholderiaceae bacterium]|nr:class I SAM-dependent methyltransferase [Burkholderiaceae bacterium]
MMSTESQPLGRYVLRADFEEIQKKRGDFRPASRIYAHYELERRLAERLRLSQPAERSAVYSEVYAELFRSLPDHPQHTAARTEEQQVGVELNYIRPLLSRDAVMLEIGCGDARLSFSVAPMVKLAYGLDVTDAVIKCELAPANFQFIKTGGINIDLPDNTVDIAYSNQLMEHLHPDDAENQLKEVARILKPGGEYWCRTPNRVTGPHDISCYFDRVATGFHLREYDYGSIHALFLRAGFRSLRFYVIRGERKIRLPYWLARTAEWALQRSARLARVRQLRRLMDLNVVGTK